LNKKVAEAEAEGKKENEDSKKKAADAKAKDEGEAAPKAEEKKADAPKEEKKADAPKEEKKAEEKKALAQSNPINEKKNKDIGPTHYDPWVHEIVSANVNPVPTLPFHERAAKPEVIQGDEVEQ